MSKRYTEIRFAGSTDIPVLKKIYEKTERQFIIKREVAGTSEILNCDLRNVPAGVYISPNGHLDTIISIDVEVESMILHLVAGNLEHAPLDAINSDALPDYVYLATGETQTPEATDGKTLTWIPTNTSLNYSKKQEKAVFAIEHVWRPQKQEWLLEATRFSDINPDLLKFAGYYLNSADQALQKLFQDPLVDPLVVAQMARAAALGALDIDSVEKFAETLDFFIRHTQGALPTEAKLWVTKSGNTVDAVVTRMKLAESVSYGTFEAAHNSISREWIKEDQPGIVEVDNKTPSSADTITATLTDFDGVQAGTEAWFWLRETETPGSFREIANSQAAAYTVAAPVRPGDKIQATVNYTDSYGPNQYAQSEVLIVT